MFACIYIKGVHACFAQEIGAYVIYMNISVSVAMPCCSCHTDTGPIDTHA